MNTNGERSIGELMHELLADTRTLMRQEVALARAESREQVKQFVTLAIVILATAAALSVAGLWIVLGAIGVILAAVVVHQMRTITVLPKTRASLKEHAHWSITEAVGRP